MNAFHCSGCNQYLSANESGYNELKAKGFSFCDNYEESLHGPAFSEFMNESRRILGTGEAL